MKNIDFSQLKDIDKKLSPQEITQLNELFASEQVQKDLEEIEHQRKIRQKWYIGAGLILSIVWMIVSFIVGTLIWAEWIIWKVFGWLFYTIGSGDNSTTPVLEGWIWAAVIVFWLIYTKFRSKIEIPLKRDVLTKICTFLDSKLEYSYDAKFSFNDLDTLQQKQFISRYTILDLVEDSTSLQHLEDGKGFYMRGFELETSKVSWSGKKRKKVITNHDYITKLVFPKARIPLKSDIYVKSKEYNNLSGINRIIVIIVAILMLMVIIWIFFSVMQEWWSAWLIFLWVFIIVPIVIMLLFSLFSKPKVNANKIFLEDVNFNKKFDVYCDDEIGSRMILTPAFMQRIIDFTSKTKQAYSFLFTNNTVYIKRKIQWKYLEVWTWRDLFKNIQGFVQFFVDMREVLLLSKDLNFLYLSKTDVNQFNPAQEIVVSETPVNFSQENKTSFFTGLFWFGKKTSVIPAKL